MILNGEYYLFMLAKIGHFIVMDLVVCVILP